MGRREDNIKVHILATKGEQVWAVWDGGIANKDIIKPGTFLTGVRGGAVG
jgi:hypothetical protein